MARLLPGDEPPGVTPGGLSAKANRQDALYKAALNNSSMPLRLASATTRPTSLPLLYIIKVDRRRTPSSFASGLRTSESQSTFITVIALYSGLLSISALTVRF